jgi:hypothetical protein
LICSAAVEQGKSCCTRKQPWRKTHTRPPRGGEREKERDEAGNEGTRERGNNTFVFPFSFFLFVFCIRLNQCWPVIEFRPRCQTGYIPGINDLPLGYLFIYLFIYL